jgi:hypothetical protein
MLLPVKEFTDGAGPCTWADNATEPNKSTRTNIALFTSFIILPNCSMGVPSSSTVLDPSNPVWLLKIQTVTYLRTLPKGDSQIGDYHRNR